MPARSSTHSSRRVPVLDGVLELLLDDAVAGVVGLDQRDLAVLRDQLAGEVPADLAGAGDDHVHLGLPPHGRERDLCDLVDCNLRRADRVQPLLGVPRRPRRVGDTDDHPRHLEAPLRDLRDHQVRVVATRSRR